MTVALVIPPVTVKNRLCALTPSCVLNQTNTVYTQPTKDQIVKQYSHLVHVCTDVPGMHMVRTVAAGWE